MILPHKKSPAFRRKPAVIWQKWKCADEPRQRALPPMPSGRDRPLSNTDPPSCNSSALTSRRPFVLLVPEPTFSERSLQWLLFATRHFCRFGPFLTSTAPSAGGITPFLQNCRLTVTMYRLYSDSHTTSQDLLFNFWPRFLSQSNILCEKARNALRCKAFQIYARKKSKIRTRC